MAQDHIIPYPKSAWPSCDVNMLNVHGIDSRGVTVHENYCESDGYDQ